MAKKREADSWGPWQLSSWFVSPLIVVAIAIFAVLEALVQIGDVPLEASTMRTEWLDWYCTGNSSANCIDLPNPLSFRDSASSKSGLLTFLLPDTISPAATFAWLYLPTILAIVYAILWQVVDDEVKRIEPFYQAQLPGGATAASSLFASYMSVPPILVPLQAIRWRQMAVFLSSTTYVLVGFVSPILQSLMFQIQNQVILVGYNSEYSPDVIPLERGSDFTLPENVVGQFTDSLKGVPIQGDLPGLTNYGKLQNVVYLDPTYARAQEAILLLAAVTGVLLLWTTQSRKMATKSSLSGLGSLASLAAPYPDFLVDMAPLAEAQDSKEAAAAEKQLGSRIVHLGTRSGDDDDSKYGFWFEPRVGHECDGNDTSTPKSGSKRKWTSPYFTLRLVSSISWVVYIYFIVVILIEGGISKETASPESSYDRASSQGSQGAEVGIAALNLVVVSVVKSLWVIVEEHVTTLSPFRSLGRKHRRAYPIFLREYESMPVFWRTYRALRDGELALAAVTIVSILLEVCLACFGITTSMAQGQGFNLDAMWVVHWIALAVCGMMFFLSANFLAAVLKSFVVIERNPDTLGSRLSYLCKSPGLLADFAPMQVMNDGEKDAYIRSIPYEYWLRTFGCQARSGRSLDIQAVDRVVGEA